MYIQNPETATDQKYLNAQPVVVESASDTAANEDNSVSSAADKDEDMDYPWNSEIVLEAKSGGFQTKSVVVAQLLLVLTIGIGMHHLRVVFF